MPLWLLFAKSNVKVELPCTDKTPSAGNPANGAKGELEKHAVLVGRMVIRIQPNRRRHCNSRHTGLSYLHSSHLS